ncbi:MAG TPA: class I SAM-dependent methyltransferase [Steroidobacteraceae bacterium]|nr:class I SAM-dependent methyltransferase [Steroidobacteraceae bacterium]
MTDHKAAHWQTVYQTRASTSVSWFRPHLDVSLELLKHAGLNIQSRIIDVGAGASTLVDDLLSFGVQHIAVMDISAASLDIAKQRLGEHANRVEWIVDDVVQHVFAPSSVDIWHDRAVLHFLTARRDATSYVAQVLRAVVEGGYVIIGCFASDGPEMCSSLPVQRREPEEVAALFGSSFELIEQRHEMHTTPAGNPQSFAYTVLRKLCT